MVGARPLRRRGSAHNASRADTEVAAHDEMERLREQITWYLKNVLVLQKSDRQAGFLLELDPPGLRNLQLSCDALSTPTTDKT